MNKSPRSSLPVIIRIDRKFGWQIIFTNSWKSIRKNHNNASDNKAHSLIVKVHFSIISSNEAREIDPLIERVNLEFWYLN